MQVLRPALVTGVDVLREYETGKIIKHIFTYTIDLPVGMISVARVMSSGDTPSTSTTRRKISVPFGYAEPPDQRLVEGVNEASLLFRRDATGWDMGVRNRHFCLPVLTMSWIFAILTIGADVRNSRFD